LNVKVLNGILESGNSKTQYRKSSTAHTERKIIIRKSQHILKELKRASSFIKQMSEYDERRGTNTRYKECKSFEFEGVAIA
jgi:hypothetical protein